MPVKSLGKGGQSDVHEAVDKIPASTTPAKSSRSRGQYHNQIYKRSRNSRRRLRRKWKIVEKAKHVSSLRLPSLAYLKLIIASGSYRISPRLRDWTAG